MIKRTKRTMGWLLALPPFNIPCLAISIVVGSEIYFIGGEVDGARTSAVRIFDCRIHTWRDAPSMNVARHSYIYSCVYDGKIYVMGGCNDDEPWAEIFDTKTQTWELFQDPFKCWAYRMAEIQGKIYFQAADKMYAYDIKQDKWECWENENATLSPSCVMENVWYCCEQSYVFHGCLVEWYDINDRIWKEVQGLDSLQDKYLSTKGFMRYTTLVSCSGKLSLIWKGYMNDNPNDINKIWCAEIVMEKRNGAEVWGYVEWVGVVHSIPTSSYFLQCLAVSV